MPIPSIVGHSSSLTAEPRNVSSNTCANTQIHHLADNRCMAQATSEGDSPAASPAQNDRGHEQDADPEYVDAAGIAGDQTTARTAAGRRPRIGCAAAAGVRFDATAVARPTVAIVEVGAATVEPVA